MAAQQIRESVERYVQLVGTGPTAEILALYAPDAVIEDPIGSEPRRGHAAIGELYDALAQLQRKTELHAVRATDRHAAVSFTLVTEAGGTRMTLSPIDVMEFDDEGRITSMRAYWGPDDAKIDPIEG
ncbi:nuclear transport factor 2 family protein [Nocardia blacklockiae]|uniref:nuclear transport factor 2 family protein n=1 Tax=Nocardia blacklockiae TaxID=480036 RepID=UPI0018944CAE|nr:nuclear transport factor 2 family protein [Nocardia blacklockiae]MBF6172134.1 nuclear transport factor 2 family protein [Nocardia blacklockiae]